MKLIKLKCPSCGANLEVDGEKKEFVCKFCRSKSLLDDEVIKIEHTIVDKNKEAFLGIFKGFGLAWIISSIFTGLVVLGIVGTIIYFIIYGVRKDLEKSDSGNNSIVEKYDVSSFNNSIEHYSGTNSSFFVGNMLDKIVTINKTNKDHNITVVYNGIVTTDTTEIVNIKHSLEKWVDYEVYLDYDDIGFINKVTIEKIN